MTHKLLSFCFSFRIGPAATSAAQRDAQTVQSGASRSAQAQHQEFTDHLDTLCRSYKQFGHSLEFNTLPKETLAFVQMLIHHPNDSIPILTNDDKTGLLDSPLYLQDALPLLLMIKSPIVSHLHMGLLRPLLRDADAQYIATLRSASLHGAIHLQNLADVDLFSFDSNDQYSLALYATVFGKRDFHHRMENAVTLLLRASRDKSAEPWRELSDFLYKIRQEIPAPLALFIESQGISLQPRFSDFDSRDHQVLSERARQSRTRIPGAPFISSCLERGELPFLRAYCQIVSEFFPAEKARWSPEQHFLLHAYGVEQSEPLPETHGIRTFTPEEDAAHVTRLSQSQGTPWLDTAMMAVQVPSNERLWLPASITVRRVLMDILSRPEVFMENLQEYNTAMADVSCPDVGVTETVGLEGDAIHHVIPERTLDPKDWDVRQNYAFWLFQTREYLQRTFGLALDMYGDPIPTETANQAVAAGRLYTEGFSCNQPQHDDTHILQIIALLKDPRIQALLDRGIPVTDILHWMVYSQISFRYSPWTMYIDNMPVRGRFSSVGNFMKSHKYLGGPNAVSHFVMMHNDERLTHIQRLFRFKLAVRFGFQEALTGIPRKGLAVQALYTWNIFSGPVMPKKMGILPIRSLADAYRAYDKVTNPDNYTVGF